MKKKFAKAFTLAEVLITLAIVGVVAALTLPNLIQNHKYAVLHNQFKTAYSDISNAARMFYVNNGESVSSYASAYGSIRSLEKFQKEYVTVAKKHSYRYGLNDAEGNSIKPPYYFGGIRQGSRNYTSICDNSGLFWDPQGRVISFDDSPKDSNINGPKLCVDINGEKLPNRYGLDAFVFMFTADGDVIPWGQEHPKNPAACLDDNNAINCVVDRNLCRFNGNPTDQYACAMYALADKHPIDNTKTYWKDFIKGK